MLGLFKKKENFEQAAPAVQANSISYHANLINELEKDHRRLLAIHTEIREDFAKQNLKAVAKGLEEFSALLRHHLLTENMRLYVYLQQQIKHDDINSQLVRFFRREMDEIARPAIDFLERYSSIDKQSKESLAVFVNQLDDILGEVHARMQREEKTLYPLYAPPVSSF